MAFELLGDEPVANGVHGADVEAASATETVSGEHLASDTAFGSIKGTSFDAGLAFGAAVVVNPYAKDTHSLKEPTQ